MSSATLGKTIEASLVIAQRWAERKRRILLIVPASLRKQWSQELFDKFSLPSVILESRSYNEARKKGAAQPFLQDGRIVITSYEFAAAKTLDVSRGQWDLVVFDEAHRLRNVYKQDGSKRAKALRGAGTAQAASGAPIDPNELADEIEELELYCALALKIGSNAKGRELVGALPKALGASRRQQMLRPARPRQGHVRTGREADSSGPQGKSEDQPQAKQIAPAEGVTPPG